MTSCQEEASKRTFTVCKNYRCFGYFIFHFSIQIGFLIGFISVKKGTLEFGWTERYKVALGVAEALDYLHNRDLQPVIHRDVKSSNILLSDDFEPQV